MGNKPRLVMLLLLVMVLQGCWDLEEADYRAFMTAAGIDIGPQNQVTFTAQIPLLQNMLPPGARSGGKREKNYHTVSAKADSVFEACRALQTKIHRHLVIQQNKLIILGEETARTGVKPFIEWLNRSAKNPPQTLVFIARRRTAKEILSVEPATKNMPALDFALAKEIDVKPGPTYFIPLWSFREKLVNQTEDAFAPLLDFDDQEGQYIVEGLAVFNGDRMAGELTAREAEIFGLLTGKMKAGVLSFKIPAGGTGKMISLRNVSVKTRIKVSLHDGKPFFAVRVNLSGSINEVIGFNREISLNLLKYLENAIKKDTTSRIQATIRKLQQLNSDPIDFGEEFRVQHQKFWEKQNWKQVFPDVSFSVIVKASILRDGILR
jgi:spore germination protein KC